MNDRELFESVAMALREFPGWPPENRALIDETVSSLDIEQVYIPPGRSYIGLVLRGGGSVVYIASGYIAGLRDGRDWIELPVNRIRDGGYSSRRDLPRDICPLHFIELPLTGLCEDCQ